MLPIKKLYIDSTARTADSKSTSELAVDLVESLTMPEGAKFQVCDVLIPHCASQLSWSYFLIFNRNRSTRSIPSGSGFGSLWRSIRNDLTRVGSATAGQVTVQNEAF